MRLLLVTGCVVLFSTCAAAGPCVPGTLQDYINLGAAGCTGGVALFKDFLLASGQSFAIPIPPSQVQVTPSGTTFMPSLQFTLNKSAAADELFESFFHFDVSAAALRRAMLTLGGSTATGDGAAIATADICPNGSFFAGGPIGCPTSPQSLITDVSAFDSTLTDSRNFAFSSFFDVFVDLTIDGGLSGTAHMGSATFQVAAVPEPSTVLLVGIGCGALFLRRFRRRL